MMDWISGLAAQDQSFESLAAKRDLTKKMALLQDVAQMGLQKKAQEEQRALQEREFNQRLEQTKALQDETKRAREVSEADRKAAAKLQRYNTIHDNMKPGDRVSKSRNAADIELMNENATGNQFEADPNNPDEMIYRKHQFEQEQLAIKQAQEKAAAQEKRAQEDQARQDKQFKLQEDAAKRAEQTAERNKKAFEAKQKDLDNKATQLSPAGRAEASQAAKAMLDATEKSGGFFGSDEEVAAKRAQIVHDTYDKVLKREQAAKGQPPPPSQLVQPTGDGYLTPEEVKKLFPTLPPGTRVKRIG